MFAKLKESMKKAQEARRTKCEKCGISKATIDQQEREKSRRLKAMGAGLVMDFSALGLLKCSKCGKIACSKCALELPGHSEKSCPFCKADYEWGSIVD